MGKGFFITLEGCEGSGKSTQLKMLEEYLKKSGKSFIFTREPGGTPIAEEIRKIILDGKNVEMEDETEALLYASARAQHIKEKIIPSKNQGKIVICDRYIDSSFAYQAYARGLGMEFIKGINVYAVQNCMPDLTLFFDISPEEAFKRKGGADKDDRLEQSGLEFHKRVYLGYKKLAEEYSDRIAVIDARQSADKVFESVIEILRKREII
ncbi:MAG: dTMP kinase [Clostridiales bacterium]|nr:dTMP kinase [Clostridiales bacterium]